VSAGVTELVEAGASSAEGTLAAPEVAALSPVELFWRRLRRDKVALIALGFIVFLLLVALFAPLLVKLFGARPPNEQDSALLDEFGTAHQPFGKALFGTDGVGRDVFSRVLYGARVSLQVAFIATGIGVTIGVVLGLVAGYYRGWVDSLISRMLDVMLAFPVLLLGFGLAAACSLGNGCIALNYNNVGNVLMAAGVVVVALTAAWETRKVRREADEAERTAGDILTPLIPGLAIVFVGFVLRYVVQSEKGALIQPGLSVVIFIIALATFPYMARIVRGQVLSLREKEFVDAARAMGASDRRIIFREILPNLVAPIIVYTTLLIPTNILFEAALSFLGVGVTPPNASWGAMIADATDIFDTAWWYMLFPGLALLFTVLSFNLVGDGLQDALNPKTGRQ
jgi:ABC-type dipeptide/oligopeptide/nickel transport system permease subunit